MSHGPTEDTTLVTFLDYIGLGLVLVAICCTASLALAISTSLRAAASGSVKRLASTYFHAAARSSLSAPRMTIFIASSGNGRCSALASSHGARIHMSRSSVGGQDHRHSLGMDRLDDAFGDVVRKP